MTKQNADNEQIKRKYFAYLKEAMRIWLSPNCGCHGYFDLCS